MLLCLYKKIKMLSIQSICVKLQYIYYKLECLCCYNSGVQCLVMALLQSFYFAMEMVTIVILKFT